MNDHLYWRYATKKFDPTKTVSQETLAGLLDVLRLAPSSFGLQPWKFVLVLNQALREDVRKHAWNQPQVTDASHLIVLCSLKSMDEAYVNEYVLNIAKAHEVPVASLAGYQQVMLDFIKSKTPQQIQEWMKRQVYIALGMLLYACAEQRIDACPMEGFDPRGVDEVLGLDKQGLESVVLCPIGHRAPDDRYADFKKVRFDKNTILIEK